MLHHNDSPPDTGVHDGEAMLLAVYRAVERLTAELDLSRALEEIIACVRDPLGLDRAGVFVYRRHRRDLTRLIGIGRDGSLEHGPETPIRIDDARGPMQQVALGRMPYFHSHDVRRDVAPDVRMPPDLRAHAIVPLIHHGQIIGVMAVDNVLTGRDIPESLIRPLRLFAHFAAQALGNALRAHHMGELNRKLQRLVELSGSLSSILRPEALLERMLAEVPELLRADRYSSWRRRSRCSWECVAARGLSSDYLVAAAELYRPDSRGISTMERVFRSGEPVFVADASASSALRPYDALISQEGFQSIFSIPLCHGTELLGCVNLYYDEPPELTDEDREIARLFARHAGIALRNAELFERQTTLDEQLHQANQELQMDKQLLLARQEELRQGEIQKKQFYRDVLYAVTNGKFVLCDRDETLRRWENELTSVLIQEAEDVKNCRALVQELACAAGMPDERVKDLCLCVSEAATNALKHAGGGLMSISHTGDRFRVRVADHGSGIEAMQLPHATLLRGYSTRASMGLGFTLMHEMSDRLSLATDPEGTILIIEMAVNPEARADGILAALRAVEL